MKVAGPEGILARVETLPPLPDTTLRLIRTVNDPTSSFADIVEVIRYDQTVTTEVLRLCNSARFALARKVGSIDEAVVYLGTAAVVRLVLAAHAHSLLSPAQAGYGLRPGSLWTHSVGVAIAAQAMGRRLEVPEPGTLFTIGLLHDIGKVLLNEYVAREYVQIAGLVARERVPFHEAEGQVLGFTHAELGAMAAERWGLPGPIVDGIRYHHSPNDAPDPDVRIEAVHLADAACIVIGIGGGDDGLFYRADASVVARHGLTERDIEAIGLETVSDLKAVQELFVQNGESRMTDLE